MIEEIKVMIGVDLNDHSLDEKLNWIMEASTSRLKVLLGGIEPPEELKHIIVEVSIKRFNRIGSEGMSSISVEGESNSYNSNDFDEFANEIQEYLDSKKDYEKGRLRFL
jgi:hypothetical protein